jgi:hypothetical protein
MAGMEEYWGRCRMMKKRKEERRRMGGRGECRKMPLMIED